jgi:hypothetical protein
LRLNPVFGDVIQKWPTMAKSPRDLNDWGNRLVSRHPMDEARLIDVISDVITAMLDGAIPETG